MTTMTDRHTETGPAVAVRRDMAGAMGRALRGAAVLVVLPIVAGCGLIPPEGPSQIDMRPRIDSGPSAQRLGPDGYPLLGAFPKSAAAQLPEAKVVAERGQLQSVAGAQAATVQSGSAEYQRSVADSRAAQATTRRDVDVAVAQARGTDGPLTATSDDVLRDIEGQ